MEEKKNNFQKEEPVYSIKVKAGRKRTYFIDVRETRMSDYFITLTESKKRQDGGYDRHKLYLYKEDFNKFLEGINDVVNHVKTQLMPEYDFDEFSRKQEEYEKQRSEEGGTDHQGSRNDFSSNGGSDTSVSNSHTEPEESVTPPPPSSPDNTSAPPVNDEDLKW